MGEAYLEHRVLTEPADGNVVILRIRQIAQRLCEERNGEVEMGSLIKKLSSHLKDKNIPGNLEYAWTVKDYVERPGDYELDLYLAAVVTQTQAIIDRWLASEETGRDDSPLFGQGFRVAAEHGDHALLAALMARKPSDTFRSFRDFRGSLVSKVIQFQREDATRFLFGLATNKDPWYGNKRNGIQLFKPSTVGIFEFMRGKAKETGRESDFNPGRLNNLLEHCATEGQPEMVRFLLEMGARPSHMSYVLVNACILGYKEVVRLFLAQCDHCTCRLRFHPPLECAIGGGDPEIVLMLLDRGLQYNKSIEFAAEKGYSVILEILFKNGEYEEKRLQDLLVHAVKQENERMSRLLLSRGVDPKDPKTITECVRAAKERGFGSMLDLLTEAGVDVENAT